MSVTVDDLKEVFGAAICRRLESECRDHGVSFVVNTGLGPEIITDPRQCLNMMLGKLASKISKHWAARSIRCVSIEVFSAPQSYAETHHNGSVYEFDVPGIHCLRTELTHKGSKFLAFPKFVSHPFWQYGNTTHAASTLAAAK